MACTLLKIENSKHKPMSIRDLALNIRFAASHGWPQLPPEIIQEAIEADPKGWEILVQHSKEKKWWQFWKPYIPKNLA
jgi:hypothetical protein